MRPEERLLAQEQLIDLIILHQYVPHKSQENYGQVLAAMRELNPSAVYCPECSGGMMDIAVQARAVINRYKKELAKADEKELKFMTFPDQNKKKGISEEHKRRIREGQARRRENERRNKE